jgi:hypothetical protein
VTGQIVVYISTVSVTTCSTVEERAGQFVTEAAHEVMVCMEVAYTISVVCPEAAAESTPLSAEVTVGVDGSEAFVETGNEVAGEVDGVVAIPATRSEESVDAEESDATDDV